MNTPNIKERTRRALALAMRAIYGHRGGIKPPRKGTALYWARIRLWRIISALYEWSGIPRRWHLWASGLGSRGTFRCHCEKYSRTKHRWVSCEHCGTVVEICNVSEAKSTLLFLLPSFAAKAITKRTQATSRLSGEIPERATIL